MIKGDKIGCFSDIHIGLYQDNPKWHQISLDFAKWASQYYLQNGINDIVILGDIFHNRLEISVNTLSVAKKFFDFFKDFNVYILAGNHDSFYKDNSKINSISIFDGWNNIKIVDNEPLQLKIYNKDAVLVPWGTSFDKIPKCDIIFGHFEIVSFYMNTYKMCEHGFTSENLFEKAKTILSGHFHKKDHRIYKNGEIVYLGSPYQQNYGDASDERGIYIYDIDKNTFEFVKNDISPRHIKLSLKKIINKEIDISFLKEKIPNNHVNFIVDSSIDDEKLTILSSKIQKLNPLTFRTDFGDNSSLLNSISNGEIEESVDLIENIEKYVESLDMDDKKEVVSYINEVYNSLIK